MKRFLCFLIPFALIVNLGYSINFSLGGAMAGVGFFVVYYYGEKRDGSGKV